MTLAETFPRFHSPIPVLQSSLHHALRLLPPVLHFKNAVELISDHDTDLATSRVVNSLETVGRLEDIETTPVLDTHDHLRFVHIASIAYKDRLYGVRVTSDQDNPFEISRAQTVQAIFPGILADPNTHAAGEFHELVSAITPNDATLSINNEGIGDKTSPMTLWESMHHSFTDKALARLAIMHALFPGADFTLTGTSKGGKTAVELACENAELSKSKRLDLTRLNLVTPPLVPPDEAKDVFLKKFLPAARCDAEHPEPRTRYERLKATRTEAKGKPRHILGEVYQLTKGTQEDRLYTASDAVNQLVIAWGGLDPLRKPEWYRQVKRRHPDKVRLLEYPELGHCVEAHLGRIVSDLFLSENAQSENAQSQEMQFG